MLLINIMYIVDGLSSLKKIMLIGKLFIKFSGYIKLNISPPQTFLKAPCYLNRIIFLLTTSL